MSNDFSILGNVVKKHELTGRSIRGAWNALKASEVRRKKMLQRKKRKLKKMYSLPKLKD